jgi:hypothetical protein
MLTDRFGVAALVDDGIYENGFPDDTVIRSRKGMFWRSGDESQKIAGDSRGEPAMSRYPRRSNPGSNPRFPVPGIHRTCSRRRGLPSRLLELRSSSDPRPQFPFDFVPILINRFSGLDLCHSPGQDFPMPLQRRGFLQGMVQAAPEGFHGREFLCGGHFRDHFEDVRHGGRVTFLARWESGDFNASPSAGGR